MLDLNYIENLRDKLKSFSRVKLAYIGGEGNDGSFEETLGKLARAYINDKAPSLKPYDTGFQVVERSDDDNKALGIVAFKINGMQLYTPVFYTNAEIKGHELLYLADQDTFVPLKEAWINEILRRKTISIGDPTSRSVKGMIPPNLDALRSPYIKSGGYEDEFLRGVCAFARIKGERLIKTARNMQTLIEDVIDCCQPEQYFPYVTKKGYKKIARLVKDRPIIGAAFKDSFDRLTRVYNQKQAEYNSITSIMERDMKNQHWLDTLPSLEKKGGSIKVISYHMSIMGGEPFGFSDDERNQLAQKGYVVQDERSNNEVSKIITNNDVPTETFAPTGTGVYDILMRDGSTKKMVYIKSQDFDCDKCSRFLIDPKSDECDNLCDRQIWATFRYPGNEYSKWLSELNTADNIPQRALSKNSRDNFMFECTIMRDGDSSPIFLNDTGGAISVHSPLQVINKKDGKYKCNGGTSVLISDIPGTKFGFSKDAIRIPCNARVFAGYFRDENFDTEPDPFVLSRSARKSSSGFKKDAAAHGLEPLKVFVKSGECSINNSPYMTCFDGFKTLIVNYGLREKDAKSLMTKAESDYSGVYKCALKRGAYEGSNVGDSHFSLPFPDPRPAHSGLFTSRGDVAPNDHALVRGTTTTYNDDSYDIDADSPYPSQDIQALESAIASGQKEIFDVSMIKQLLVNSDTDAQIDKIIAQLIRGMDSAGRLLFLFYWKGDQFEELYGPRKLPELEGSIRKGFEVFGDLVLFLKRNKLENTDRESIAAINLGDNTK